MRPPGRDWGDTVTSSGTQTFPKAARVCRRVEYLSIQREGERVPSGHFLVVHRPGATPIARLGITVTKKIGGAVVRNRIKRAVRECFRKVRLTLPAVDLVVIARDGAGELTVAEISHELGRAFARLPRGEPA